MEYYLLTVVSTLREPLHTSQGMSRTLLDFPVAENVTSETKTCHGKVNRSVVIYLMVAYCLLFK